MSYVQKLLMPDEKIVYMASLHWIIFRPGLMLTLVGGLLGYFSYTITGRLFSPEHAAALGRIIAGVGLIFSIAGLMFLIAAFVRQSATELAITNRRLIAKYGFISRSTFEVMANRITGVNFDQTVEGRLLGFGTILVHGAGGDITPFDTVSRPQAFQRALMSVIEHAPARPVVDQEAAP